MWCTYNESTIIAFSTSVRLFLTLFHLFCHLLEFSHTRGIVVARLKGRCSERTGGFRPVATQSGKQMYDTVIGNKQVQYDPEGLYDEIVLKQSSQVIPLVRFSSLLTSHTPAASGNISRHNLKNLYSTIEEVKKVVDEFCNDGKATPFDQMSLEDFNSKTLSRSYSTSRAYVPPPPPPPPNPVYNPLPPTMPFAVQPPRPRGLPMGTSLRRQQVPTSYTANAAGAKLSAGTASIPSATTTIVKTKVIGAKIVEAASKILAEVEYNAPRSLEKAVLTRLKIVGEDEMAKLVANESDCVICLCPLDDNDKEDTGNDYAGYISSVNSARRQEKRRKKAKRLVRLPCGHVFHQGCIVPSIASLGNRCPYKCTKMIGEAQGKSPSGTMKVVRNKTMHCSGFENDPSSSGTIIIQYHIPRGIQVSRICCTIIIYESYFYAYSFFAFHPLFLGTAVVSSKSRNQSPQCASNLLSTGYTGRERPLVTIPIRIFTWLDIHCWYFPYN